MSKNKLTWNDIQEAHQNDLKRVYKLDSRGLEQATRKHMDGATPQQRRELYEKLYGKRDY